MGLALTHTDHVLIDLGGLGAGGLAIGVVAASMVWIFVRPVAAGIGRLCGYTVAIRLGDYATFTAAMGSVGIVAAIVFYVSEHHLW